MEQDILYGDFPLFMVVMGTRMRLTLGEHTEWLIKLPQQEEVNVLQPPRTRHFHSLIQPI